MNTSPTIIPITQARSMLGKLAQKVSGGNYILLTKGGKPKAALVDADYLKRLEEDVRRVYQKTFINKETVPYTRKFSEEEIKKWQKEDSL